MNAFKQTAKVIRRALPPPVRRGFARVGGFLGADPDSAPNQPSFPSIEASLRTLRNLGFESASCIDVGAYRGDWTRTFKAEFPDSRVLMVEAQKSRHDKLAAVARELGGNVQVETALLGSTDGESVDFTVMNTGSSVFPEASPYPRRTEKQVIQSLDSVAERTGFLDVDFLKLDVQGYELEILKGATRVLPNVQVVLLEVSLVAVNSGCPLVGEVMSFMSTAGFRLFDFCSQTRRKDGVLWQTDFLFLNNDVPFVPVPQLNKDNWWFLANGKVEPGDDE
jgi:FkbM family methyltransferase